MAVDVSFGAPRPARLGSDERPLPIQPWHVLVLALGAALLAGALMTRNPAFALGLVGACVFLPAIAFNLQLGIGLWTALLWSEYSQVFGPGPFAATLVVVFASLGARGAMTVPTGGRRAQPRPETVFLVLLLLWLGLSIAWADDTGLATETMREWIVAAVAFIVVFMAIQTPDHARIICAGFVLGAVISLLIGLSGKGVTTTADAIDTATQSRFSGGAGDPNVLCAGLIPAFAMTLALMGRVRDPLAKLGMLGVALAIAGGIAATQSRGGILAIVVVFIAGLVFLKGQRLKLLSLLLVLIVGLGAAMAAKPGSLDRVTEFDSAGSGRSELWHAAWEMAQDNPVAGVGLNNFTVHSKDYARKPGGLKFVRMLVEKPFVTHNAYLQQLAETGFVGLGLMLGMFIACIAAGLRAARRWDRLGDASAATLSRAVALGAIGMLTASVFISDATDKRLWILLALGPGLLAAARRADAHRMTSP